MHIQVSIDPKVAVKNGFDAFGKFMVEIPANELTERERLVISECHWDDRAQAFIFHAFSAPVATPATVRAALAEAADKRQQAELAKAASEAERLAARSAWEALPLGERINANNHPTEWFPDSTVWNDTKEECNRRNVLERERREAAYAAAEAAKEALAATQTAALAEWANTHGSELLKARIAGNFAWKELAREEFADQALAPVALQPNNIDDDYEECNEPTLEQMHLLQSAQQKVGDQALAELVTEEDDSSTVFIRFTVTCPDGAIVKRYFYA